MSESQRVSEILWTPSDEWIARTHLAGFMQRAPGSPTDYQALWEWSVDDLAGFWGQVWSDCGVVASQGYQQVLEEPEMPGMTWFSGARLNFAENLLRRRDSRPALIGAGEGREDETVTWAELGDLVARAQRGLRDLGVVEGDRVVAFMPNCIPTVVLMLAATSLGAVWSSCSPDFGAAGVVDRFGQISPKVLVVADGYRYNRAVHPLQDKLDGVLDAIRGLAHVVVVDFAGCGIEVRGRAQQVDYSALLEGGAAEPAFAQLPFDHPLYVMYSSGTTGPPKSMVHGAGGTLVKHLEEHRLQTDIHPGDVLFWFTTCGWMMWNWLVSGLASEATLVLYDGSPTHPDIGALWRLAERTGITHFGTSPKFLAANANAGARPQGLADLSAMRSLLSTGSPLSPEQFDWVYAKVKPDVHLASVSGGTDLIGCFAGGAPILPVRRGELQARILGMAVEAWDPDGKPVTGQKGELVCTRPFPSMPTGFWNDPDGSKYRDAYFAENPGVWTHGDFIEVRPEGGVIIYGRSDTTLNPGGVRIGTAELYRAVETLAEIEDSIAVGRPVDGDVEIVLCVKPAAGVTLDEALAQRIRDAIRRHATPRHVPAHIFAVDDIPYTISGKKVEKAVRSMIAGEQVQNQDALANPESLDQYARLPFPALG